MTVPSTLTRSGPYEADGIQDVWDYTFKILNAEDIQVIVTDLDGVESEVVSGYSVTNVGQTGGGEVAFNTPPLDGYLVTFLLKPVIEQQQQYRNQGKYNPARVEFGFDRIVTMLQYFEEKFTRVVIVPVSSGDTPENYLGQVRAYRDEAAAFSANTDADSTQTALDRTATAADRVQTGLDKVATAADRVQTGLDRVQTGADRTQTGLDRTAVANDKATVAADKATVAADKSTTSGYMGTTLGYMNAASAAQVAAENARDTTLAAFDSFDDRYLGVKSADPTLDNDGNALVAGSLYYFDGNGTPANAAMKVYTGSTWVAAYVSGTGFLAAANNLSDLVNAGTARANLGLVIGTDVQAYDADLAGIAALTNAANQIIYTSGANTWANTAISAGGRALINTTAAANAVPYYTSTSAASTFATTAAGRALAGLTGAADLLGYFTSSTAAATTALTAIGRSIIGAATALAARQAIGVEDLLASMIPGGRLTLASGVPVTMTDTTGSNLYYTPYIHNKIMLYAGGVWVSRTFSEITLALSGLTTGIPNDVWAYDNAGTVALELTPWTNATTRATALARQDGILVKSGDATRRYLGTLNPNSATVVHDTEQRRYLWNYYNRARKSLKKTDATASYNYSTAAWRQWNADIQNFVAVIVGVVEQIVELTISAQFSNSTTTSRRVSFAIGDTTAGPDQNYVNPWTANGSSNATAHEGFYTKTPAEGVNAFYMLEYGSGTDTQSWLPAGRFGVRGGWHC